MARRNLKPVETDSAANSIIPNLAKNGKVDQLKIDELRLLKITRLMEKERAARYESMAAVNALNALFQDFLTKEPRGKELNDRVNVLQAEAQKAAKECNELVAQVGKDLDVNMQEYSFDDETGILHKLPPPSAAETKK